MPFMERLTGKTEQQIYQDLEGVIFLNPTYGFGGDTSEKYVTADEYLSLKGLRLSNSVSQQEKATLHTLRHSRRLRRVFHR